MLADWAPAPPPLPSPSVEVNATGINGTGVNATGDNATSVNGSVPENGAALGTSPMGSVTCTTPPSLNAHLVSLSFVLNGAPCRYFSPRWPYGLSSIESVIFPLRL